MKKKQTEKKTGKENAIDGKTGLKGFDISIDPFGEVVSSLEIERLNIFLDRNLRDLKLRHLNEEEE